MILDSYLVSTSFSWLRGIVGDCVCKANLVSRLWIICWRFSTWCCNWSILSQSDVVVRLVVVERSSGMVFGVEAVVAVGLGGVTSGFDQALQFLGLGGAL